MQALVGRETSVAVADIRNMSLWKHRLRVTVFDESSYSEIRVFSGTPRNWATWLALAVGLVVGITYLVLAHTPLREWMVPGYVAESTREDMRETRAMADSLTRLLTRQEMSLTALRHSLAGDPAALAFLQGASDPLDNTLPDPASLSTLETGAGEGEMALRSQIDQEDRFALQRKSSDGNTSIGFPFLPLAGGISSGMDVGIGHLGIDLVAPEGTAVQAVDDGSVLFSSYTVETGYTLLIQHRGERVSVYKHCASLLKRHGDLVSGGEAVALMGNTGELTTGPHLHFEWWVRGRPLDPTPWLGQVAGR